jgi:tetraacyldisaccharide 4'-kinase
MRLDAPFWWYRKQGALASALLPLGRLYGTLARAKAARVEPYRSHLPVICIGNLTAGGGGKTPTAIAVAALLKSIGERPVFLTRGYGGKSKGPVLVGKGQTATEVGDEPLLLAAHAPTMVSADRAAGAKLIEGLDASVIVMDDGFQNPQLVKDFSLIVADSGVGIGNGLVMPAGPLRAPLESQLPRADALLLIGEGDKAAPLVTAFEAQGKPVLKARMVARGDTRWLGVLPVIGFAGIANPKKFYLSLTAHGARLIDTMSFADHHRYSERQAARLMKWAREQNAMLVTTEKDWVRLPEEDGTALGELKHRSRPLLIAVEFGDPAALKLLLVRALERLRASNLSPTGRGRAEAP